MLFLDTSVFMYAFGAAHAYREPCQKIVQVVANQTLDAGTSAEVLQEIVHRYFALNRRAEAIRIVRAMPSLVPVIAPVRREELLALPGYAEKYPRLGARDLLHLTVMVAQGWRRIVTADRDFDGLEEVDRVDPADLAREIGES